MLYTVRRSNLVEYTDRMLYTVEALGQKVALAKAKLKLARSCKQEGCLKGKTHNFPGHKQRLYCRFHAHPTMERIMAIPRRIGSASTQQCEGAECTTRPSFNFVGEASGRSCGKCKLAGMTDVTNRQCEGAECTAQPSFNYVGEAGGRFCGKCKLAGMTDVTSRKCDHNRTSGCAQCRDRQPFCCWGKCPWNPSGLCTSDGCNFAARVTVVKVEMEMADV
jgi:hypothetical protein